MIKDPILLILFLVAIESLVLYLASRPRLERYFDILPAVFWIYLVPMLASSFGLIDAKADIYSKISTYLLPMALFLLLISVDLNAIMRLGPRALMMFFIGSAGIVLGMVVAYLTFKDVLGASYWSGFGALAGSWTGGSANMVAVKEALGTPDDVFLPMVVVDTIVPYVWMGLMVACVGLAPALDRFNRADRRLLDDLGSRLEQDKGVKSRPLSVLSVAGLLLLACAGGLAAVYVGRALPVITGVISSYAWTVIIVSMLGLSLSMTPVRRLEVYGTGRVGYFILYFVLTSIGAKAGVSQLGLAFVLLAAGFMVVAIHAVILLLALRLMKAPLFLAVVASQANIGGVASAPLVAEIYQKGFAGVGLLLAILGNIEGTYLGIITGHICRLLGQ